MLEHNSIIKRPVLERGENILVGFKEETLDAFFKK
jgi:arsenate reductase-like glutaredoxin family protein